MSAAERLAAALAELRAGVDEIDHRGSIEDLSELAALLDDMAGTVKAARADIDGPLLKQMGARKASIDGFDLSREGGNKRTQTDWPGILSYVIRLAQVPDPDTGEVPSDREVLLRYIAAVRSVAPFTPSTSARVTAMEALGMDPDEYTAWDRAPYRVEVTRRDETPAAEAGEAA